MEESIRFEKLHSFFSHGFEMKKLLSLLFFTNGFEMKNCFHFLEEIRVGKTSFFSHGFEIKITPVFLFSCVSNDDFVLALC